MKNTTLCYIERDGKYLMLYRNKKKNDANGGKYVGIGGHLEEKESPEECIIREVYEETSLKITAPQYRGLITFVSDEYETEQMHLFWCDTFVGEIGDCNEGELKWVEKSQIEQLPMWAGDIYFLRKLNENIPFFTMKLVYSGNTLVEYHLNGARQI